MNNGQILELLCSMDENIEAKVEVMKCLSDGGAILCDEDWTALDKTFNESMFVYGYINIQFCILDFAMFICKDFQTGVRLVLSYSEDEFDMDRNLEEMSEWWLSWSDKETLDTVIKEELR